jgi:hypothetical protein
LHSYNSFMEDNSSVKSLAERFQQKIFAQAPIDSLGLSPVMAILNTFKTYY